MTLVVVVLQVPPERRNCWLCVCRGIPIQILFKANGMRDFKQHLAGGADGEGDAPRQVACCLMPISQCAVWADNWLEAARPGCVATKE